MTGFVKDFLDYFSDLLANGFQIVLNNSSLVIWLIIAVLVLRFLIRKPKFIHCILWGLVGLRLILPFSLESSFSLVPDTQGFSEGIFSGSRMTEEANRMEMPELDNSLNETQIGKEENSGNVVEEIVPKSSVETQSNKTQVFSRNLTIIPFIWFTGIGIMLIYAVISYLNLKRKVKLAVRYHGNIWQSEKVSTPFVLGFLKPRIYIPYSYEKEDLLYILSHENAHIERKDPWIKLLGFVILSIYWFHPLVWLAYMLLCKDMELACDEYVLKQMGETHKINYANALLHCSTPGKNLGICPVAFGETGVKQRVKSVLNYKKPSFWFIIGAVAGIIILAVCFMTRPKSVEINPEGIYLGKECLYMNALSSVFPYDDNGLRYIINENEFRIEKVDTGEILFLITTPKLEWESLDTAWLEEEIKIMSAQDQVDISQYKNPMYCELTKEYTLFSMDGTYWIGHYQGDKELVGLWDLYRLEPDENYSESKVGGADGPETVTMGTGEEFDQILSETILEGSRGTHSRENYNQVINRKKLDVEPIMEGLLEIIMESPKESSDPADYVEEHSAEYRELTYYGQYALEYAEEQLESGEKDLKGAILEMLIEDLS